MNRKTPICLTTELNNYPGRKYLHGKITFFGLLTSQFYVLSFQWNENTQRDYIAKYSNHILPKLGEIPLEMLTEEQVRTFFAQLENVSSYSDTFIDHLRMLVYIVLHIAEQKGHLSFSVWGTDLFLSPEDRNALVDKLSRGVIPRSLTVKQQLSAFGELTQSPEQCGPNMALLLMFFCGLRNAEACAITYRDVFEFPGRPGEYVLVVHNTVRADHSMKGSGKTKNAPRVIPIPAFLYYFILRRKEFFQALLNAGRLPLKNGQSIDDLPIACTNDFVTPCNAQQVTTAGRQLFHKIQFDAQDFLLAERYSMLEKGERTPTAYLFRRNFCTDLVRIDMPEPVQQYYMGHKIELPNIDPRDFVAERLSRTLRIIMRRRPIWNLSRTADGQLLFEEYTLSENIWNQMVNGFAHIYFRRFCRAPESYMHDFGQAVAHHCNPAK